MLRKLLGEPLFILILTTPKGLGRLSQSCVQARVVSIFRNIHFIITVKEVQTLLFNLLSSVRLFGKLTPNNSDFTIPCSGQLHLHNSMNMH